MLKYSPHRDLTLFTGNLEVLADKHQRSYALDWLGYAFPALQSFVHPFL
ncbi:MAG: hypothetical protein Fur0044_30640 [Anaerolineae bacterium]|nr:hypothetical protein [Anaerolineales bacterium]